MVQIRLLATEMKSRTITTLLLVFALNYVYAQNKLNDSITKFDADCSDAISPEEGLAEFSLLRLTSNDESTTLNFEIIANCAQKETGLLMVHGDTIIIDKTDVTITNTTRYVKVDSTGQTLEITEETHIADVAFCDCLVNFYYEFAPSLKIIKLLKFHDRTFKLN